MNAQPTAPRVTKETKNKIKVEFERTPLIERLKATQDRILKIREGFLHGEGGLRGRDGHAHTEALLA